MGIDESDVNVDCTEDENNAQSSNCKVTYPADVEKPTDFDELVQKALEDKTGADPGDIEVLGNSNNLPINLIFGYKMKKIQK